MSELFLSSVTEVRVTVNIHSSQILFTLIMEEIFPFLTRILQEPHSKHPRIWHSSGKSCLRYLCIHEKISFQVVLGRTNYPSFLSLHTEYLIP
jgi:hypothetical protein